MYLLNQKELEITRDVFEVFLKKVSLDLRFEGFVGIRQGKMHKGELQDEGAAPVVSKACSRMMPLLHMA